MAGKRTDVLQFRLGSCPGSHQRPWTCWMRMADCRVRRWTGSS